MNKLMLENEDGIFHKEDLARLWHESILFEQEIVLLSSKDFGKASQAVHAVIEAEGKFQSEMALKAKAQHEKKEKAKHDKN